LKCISNFDHKNYTKEKYIHGEICSAALDFRKWITAAGILQFINLALGLEDFGCGKE
jgi:hypothetical protein